MSISFSNLIIKIFILFKFQIALLGLMLILSMPIFAAEVNGTGLLFGKNYAFFATAPSSWVLDNRSGVNDNLSMVFYPKSDKYADSNVIVYAMSVARHAKKSVEMQVRRTVALYIKKGSRNFNVYKRESIKLKNNRTIEVYHYQDDRWGNYEASAYLLEKYSLNLFVFNAKSKKLYRKNYPQFLKIVNSYVNLFDKQEKLSRANFQSKVKVAKRMSKSKLGQVYKNKIVARFSQSIVNYMQSCNRYVKSATGKTFDILFKIKKNGIVSAVNVWPLTAFSNCVRVLVRTSRYPTHKLITNFQHFRLKVK